MWRIRELRASGAIGRHSGLKLRTVWVRLPPCPSGEDEMNRCPHSLMELERVATNHADVGSNPTGGSND